MLFTDWRRSITVTVLSLYSRGHTSWVRLRDLPTCKSAAQELISEQLPVLCFPLLQWVFSWQEGPVARRE